MMRFKIFTKDCSTKLLLQSLLVLKMPIDIKIKSRDIEFIQR